MTSRLTRRTRGKQLLEENAQEENLEDAGTPGLCHLPLRSFQSPNEAAWSTHASSVIYGTRIYIRFSLPSLGKLLVQKMSHGFLRISSFLRFGDSDSLSSSCY